MRVVSSVLVGKPADLLFELSQNYARRLEWDTYLSEAYLLGSAREASLGVESHCKSRSGRVMVSRYIAYSPPTHAAVEMVHGPWPLQQFGGTWRFRKAGPTTTEVQFIYNFKLRPAALRWLLEPVVALLYGRSMQRRANAFKRWVENAA
jgi:ribosome-associated toxin RatA of RatAB toxin-antitoxin module